MLLMALEINDPVVSESVCFARQLNKALYIGKPCIGSRERFQTQLTQRLENDKERGFSFT